MNTATEPKNQYFSLSLTKTDYKRLSDASDNYKMQLEIIKEMFGSEKNFLRAEFQQMEVELLKYRSYLVTVHQAYTEAQAEHQVRLDDFWNELYKGIPALKEQVKKITNELLPITASVNHLSANLKGISTYDLKEMLSIVERVSGMSTKQVEMFQLLVSTFKPATT